jgi:hypothetical protein
MQGLLFGNAVDRFFLELENPSEDDEAMCTEALYVAAAKVRCALHDDVYEPETFAVVEQAMAVPPPVRILTQGYTDGYEGRFPQERDKRYLMEYALGREQKAAEHHWPGNFAFGTPNMDKGFRKGFGKAAY